MRGAEVAGGSVRPSLRGALAKHPMIRCPDAARCLPVGSLNKNRENNPMQSKVPPRSSLHRALSPGLPQRNAGKSIPFHPIRMARDRMFTTFATRSPDGAQRNPGSFLPSSPETPSQRLASEPTRWEISFSLPLRRAPRARPRAHAWKRQRPLHAISAGLVDCGRGLLCEPEPNALPRWPRSNIDGLRTRGIAVRAATFVFLQCHRVDQLPVEFR